MVRSQRSHNVAAQNMECEVHSIKFLKFDEEMQEFDQQDEILYDISDNLLDPWAGSFNNDFFCTKNQHTYYFQKDSKRHGFQLYRHSFGTPFHKFPIDNDPFPEHQNKVMKNYFIPAPKDIMLKDLQISFL